jgi:hypothetical protein
VPGSLTRVDRMHLKGSADPPIGAEVPVEEKRPASVCRVRGASLPVMSGL